MLQPHILCCSYDKANTSTVGQRSCGVPNYELYLTAAFSAFAGKLSSFPLVVLAFGHLLYIDGEAAVALRATQVTCECTLRRYKKVTHSCKLLSCSYRKRQNIIGIQQQVLEEVNLIGVYILGRFGSRYVKSGHKVRDYFLYRCSVFMISVPEPLRPHKYILHCLGIDKVGKCIEWIMHGCFIVTHIQVSYINCSI